MIIESGSDLLLALNLTDEKGNRIKVSSQNSFTIRVFTANKLKYLEYDKDDIVTTDDDDKLYLNSDELERLESGVIAYTYLWGVIDANFNDGEYNNQKTVYTDYYLKNSDGGSPINPDDYNVIQQIKKSIKEETTERKDADTALEDKITTLSSEKVDKVAGKGLSTNDYTTDEKNKLASLPDDFEVCTDADIDSMLKELGI